MDEQSFKPYTFHKKVCVVSIKEGILYMDKWGNGRYDMFIVNIQQSNMLDGYYDLDIYGMEWPPSRKTNIC